MNDQESDFLENSTKNAAPYPSVTIAIPVLNEAEKIEQIITGFLETKYPNLIEIFVADGGSTDETRTIVSNISQLHSRVKLLDNPLMLQAAGLNLILHECTGDIFLRADAHSEYASDYIERCIEALLETRALNVGGAQRFVAKTPFQAGVALASRSLLGSGGAKYRDPNYDGYGDTVYLGCFWKNILLNLSGYCVEVTPSEDNELNYRIEKYSSHLKFNIDNNGSKKLISSHGKAIYISSKIQVWYYPRKTWIDLWNQYFRYGKSRYQTSSMHPAESQFRGNLLLFLVSTFILLFVVSFFFPSLHFFVWSLIPMGLIIVFGESLRLTVRYHRNFNSEFWRGNQDESPSFFCRWFFCGLAFVIMPLAYFLGFSAQIFFEKKRI